MSSEPEQPYLFYNHEPQSKMIWYDESVLCVTTSVKRPNWWWRMWQYLLMGVRWEKI